MIGSGANVGFVLAVAALPLTRWGDAGDTSTSSSSTPAAGHSGVPQIEAWAWCVFFAVLSPFVLSMRTSVAISQYDPYVRVGKEYLSMKYAPHCFIGMLSSGLVVCGLSYAIPVALQARPDFFFLE